MGSVARLLRTVRRRLLIHRRGLAALCAATAVALGFAQFTAPPPPTVPVWTARRSLPSGQVLAAGDFRRTGYAEGSVPAQAVRDLDRVVGRTLITPLGAGEPLTRAKVLGHRALDGYPGRVAVAIRLTDPTLAGLLRPGDRIDVLATDPRAPPRTVAQGSIVLAVPDEPRAAFGASTAEGRLVLLAVVPDEATSVAAAAASGFLTVVWKR